MTKRETRRQVAGRRAVPAGFVLVPVKTEVPSGGAFCGRCDRATRRKPNKAGELLCWKCERGPDAIRKPKPPKVEKPTPKLKKGKVWRLCVGCDCQLQKGPGEKGPFLCYRCREEDRSVYKACIVRERPDDSPERAARVAALADLYAAVKSFGEESDAKRAGLVTSVSDYRPPQTLTVQADHEPTEDDDDFDGADSG